MARTSGRFGRVFDSQSYPNQYYMSNSTLSILPAPRSLLSTLPDEHVETVHFTVELFVVLRRHFLCHEVFTLPLFERLLQTFVVILDSGRKRVPHNPGARKAELQAVRPFQP